MSELVPSAQVGQGEQKSLRWFEVAVSAGALALAWARQEAAPHGAVVVVGRELYPMDRLGRPWQVPAEQTLACALVLRPDLPAAGADGVWLAGGLIAKQAVEEVTQMAVATWWPDCLVRAADHQVVCGIRADIQLGPGTVRSAVLSIRFDLGRLDLGPQEAQSLLEALVRAAHQSALGGSASQEAAGPLEGVSTGNGLDGRNASGALCVCYSSACGLIGERVRATLLPKGEIRGYADQVDSGARLHVKSATGMVEPVSVNALRSLEVL